MFKVNPDKITVQVLMVDDKKENLYSLQSLLEDEESNIQFIKATSGNEALNLALKYDLALILLDVQMPNMDGYEVARLLKLNKKTRDVPIIFVTALNQEANYVLEGYKKGAVDYLFKPLNPSITKAKVNAFIEMYLKQVELERHKEALMEANLGLDTKVKDRTNELTKANNELKEEVNRRMEAEERLVENNEKLRRLNADLDSFVYTASHDLKLPVANMEGLINVLSERVDSSDEIIKEVVAMLQQSVFQFKDTIHQLLEIIKVQKEGKEEEVFVDCKEVLEEVKISIRELIESTGAVIVTDFNECRTIKISRQGLKSILYNLITNAIKYQDPTRTPRIKICLHEQPGYTCLSVEDNGLGISEENKTKIFAMFKRLHSHVEGTGIGLFIVKNIVDKYNGFIEVESTIGQGTTFNLCLPK
jgi:two-component system, sensor histidine kinase and response regulator